MRLNTSLALSLSLLLGVAPAFSEAAPPSAAKSKKKKPVKPEPVDDTPIIIDAPIVAPPPFVIPSAPPAPSPEAPWAGRVVIFAVPRQPAAAAASAQLEEELRQTVGGEVNLQWVDPVTLFPPPAPRPLPEGEALYAAGKELYDNLDTDAAAKKFAEAADFYRQHPVDANPELLARACIFLGATRLLNGDTNGAQEAFTQALLAAPTVKPETGLFGQDVHDAHAAARTALFRQPRGKLTVDSVPAGAHVAVHGQERGVTPLKDVELVPGAHQVVLTLPGHVSYGTFQTVSAQPSQLSTELKLLPAVEEVNALASRLAANPKLDTEALPASVSSLGQKLEARYVVLAVVEQERKGRDQGTLYVWDTRSKNRLRGVRLNPADARERSEAMTQVQAFLTGKPAPSFNPLARLPPVMQKPWFWATVGGVAVATTAGVLLATQPPGRPLSSRLGNFGAGW